MRGGSKNCNGMSIGANFNGRVWKSGPVRTILNSVRPWVKTPQNMQPVD